MTLWPSDSATPKVFSKIIHFPTVARLFSLNGRQIWSWDPWDLLAETEPGNSEKCENPTETAPKGNMLYFEKTK